jgi:hypothetical protein
MGTDDPRRLWTEGDGDGGLLLWSLFKLLRVFVVVVVFYFPLSGVLALTEAREM